VTDLLAQSSILELTHLEIAELSELFAAVVESAGKGLQLLMDNFVCSHISSLRKGLAADVAVVRPLASVTALMSLHR
jgi:hypothetical protein